MDTRIPIEQHPQLYFDDGDIILSAQTAIPVSGLCYIEAPDAPPKVFLFRVHKVILSHHSPAFKNMFVVATTSAGDTYDGVPPMIGDRAEDLVQLLTYLYNPRCVLLSHLPFTRRKQSLRYISAFSFRRLDPDKPRRLSGMIRLMDKYIEKQRQYLIEQVTADWPTTLKGWDLRENELEFLESNSTLQPAKSYKPDPAIAIAFAREFRCKEILPAAFYQLSTTIPIDVLEHPTLQKINWAVLGREDILRYVQGSRALWSDFKARVCYGESTYLSRDCCEVDYDYAYGISQLPPNDPIPDLPKCTCALS